MIRKSFTKLKRIIFSGLVMSLCTFVFNPTTPANAAMVQESEPNDDWTTADNLSLNTWVKGTMRRKADDRYYRDKVLSSKLNTASSVTLKQVFYSA